MAKRTERAIKILSVGALVLEFINSWPYRQNDLFWYDWMVRDFFAFLLSKSNQYLFMPETGEPIAMGSIG